MMKVLGQQFPIIRRFSLYKHYTVLKTKQSLNREVFTAGGELTIRRSTVKATSTNSVYAFPTRDLEMASISAAHLK